tara:strand:- start:233 stop:604 length:372 start_codon:yes stop_codon:yes gene_type:complete
MRSEEQTARALVARSTTVDGAAARHAFAALDESRRQVDALLSAGQEASYSLLKAEQGVRLVALLEACQQAHLDITVGVLVGVGVVIEIQVPNVKGYPAAYAGSTLIEAIEAAEKHPIKRERSP